MPSTSKKQHNFMAAVANNPAFAKKAGIPQSVGSDFIKADKGHKFSKGGDTMATKGVNPFAKFEKSGKDVEKKGMKTKKMADGGPTGQDMLNMIVGNAPNPNNYTLQNAISALKSAPGMAKPGMNANARVPTAPVRAPVRTAPMPVRPAGRATALMKKGGDVKKYAKGGSVDGIAQRGKTKGTMITMKKGGQC